MTPMRQLLPGHRAQIGVLDDFMGVAPTLAHWSVLQDRADVTFITEPLPGGADRVAALTEFDALCLLRERTPVTADLLHTLPRLKAIVTSGRSNRTLDYAAAYDLGIAVMTTTGSANGIYATVELAWGLIISLLRAIPQEHAAMRDGGWQTRLGNALYGRRLGLVGLGKLGTRMASIGKAFGMEVVAWSPNLTDQRAAEAGVLRVDKDELFAQSDVISLHLVLGPTTQGVVGRADLRRMRPAAVLVNTARAGLIEPGALMEALRAQWIAGAAVDVYDVEPLPATDPQRLQHNLLTTPHLGYSVRETFAAFYRDMVDNLDGWLNGEPKRLWHPPGPPK